MLDRSTALACLLVLSSSLASACKSSGAQATDPAPTEANVDQTETRKSARELYLQGNRHLDDRQWQRAISSYKSALEKNSDDWKIYLNLGIAHASNNSFQEAIASFENALTHGGEREPRVYYNLGNAYQKRGMYDQALKAYRTSLGYREQLDADTLLNIASTLTVLGEREAARQAYRRAQQIAPRDPRIQHGLAILLYLENEPQQALDAYDQLHSIAPDYAPGYYDQARALADLQHYQQAIDALETYLKLAPDGDYAQKARGRIEIYREKLEPASRH